MNNEPIQCLNFSYYIVGLNLGFCHDNMPELFTSLLFGDVSSWIRNVTLPYHDHRKAVSYESSVCETEVEEEPYRQVLFKEAHCFS